MKKLMLLGLMFLGGCSVYSKQTARCGDYADCKFVRVYKNYEGRWNWEARGMGETNWMNETHAWKWQAKRSWLRYAEWKDIKHWRYAK